MEFSPQVQPTFRVSLTGRSKPEKVFLVVRFYNSDTYSQRYETTPKMDNVRKISTDSLDQRKSPTLVNLLESAVYAEDGAAASQIAAIIQQDATQFAEFIETIPDNLELKANAIRMLIEQTEDFSSIRKEIERYKRDPSPIIRMGVVYGAEAKQDEELLAGFEYDEDVRVRKAATQILVNA